MFSVILMSFQKKDNSTKQPTGGGLAVQGTLKEPCSIMNPTISIERLSGDASPSSYTYAYINKFGRYYFITDWRWVDGLWEVDMRVDVLASFKTEIGASSQYVVRYDSTTDFNSDITDIIYPATTDMAIYHTTFQTPFVQTISQGTYVVGIISNESANAVGAVSYYAMSSAQFGMLKDTLLSDANFEAMGILDTSTPTPTWNLDDMSKELLKTMYNPFQYIASCMWFPVSSGDIPGAGVSTIPIGWWDYTLNGKLISQQTGSFFDGVMPFQTHPQAGQNGRGDYLNYAPYCKISMYGQFGTLPIDPSYRRYGEYIINNYLVDYITGICVFQSFVASSSGGAGRIPIAKTQYQIGTPIQIAQVGVDYLGSAITAANAVNNTISSTFGGFLTGGIAGAVSGAIAGAATGVYNVLDASTPQLVTGGANGSFVTSQLSTQMVTQFYRIAEENISHKGRPLCSNRTINSLSGFIMCAEGDLDISCFEEERKRISNYLVSGFYWE